MSDSSVEEQIVELKAELNAGQLAVFEKVLGVLEGKDTAANTLIMVHGEAGAGKSFLYTRIERACALLKIKNSNSASTGIAATLLDNCSTAHRSFGLNIFGQSQQGDVEQMVLEKLKDVRVVFVDEISMLNTSVLRTMDTLCRRSSEGKPEEEQPFGGKVVLLGGDRCQLVPVSGPKSSIYASEFMGQFHHMVLDEQVRQAGDSEFVDYLRKVGSGAIRWLKIGPEQRVYSLEALIEFVYGDRLDRFEGGLLVCTRNKTMHEVNQHVMDMLEGEEVDTFEAVDTLAEGNLDFKPAEEELYHLPPKTLKLKKGVIVMMLKNVDVRSGLANGARFIYEGKEGEEAIRLRVLGGGEQQHTIQRIHMNAELKKSPIPGSKLRREQFPVRLAFCSTAHKAQGQTVNRLGIFAPKGCCMFAPGMAYTTLSRLRGRQGLRVFAEYSHNPHMLMIQNHPSPFARAQITADGKWVE